MPEFDKEFEKFANVLKEHCDHENKAQYKQTVAILRRNELWFHGNQFIYYNYLNNDWVNPPSLTNPFGVQNDERGTNDFYDYIINILRAHGENFISVLSSQIPTTIFPPADVSIANDISTARAYNKIAEMIDNYNPISYLFMRLLFIKFIQGPVAIYVYPEQDEKYGKYKVPKYGKNEDGKLELQSYEDVSKTRVLIDIFGPDTVKFPFYVKSQSDMGYIQQHSDIHYALMQEIYDDDKIQPNQGQGRDDRSPTNYTVGLDYEENKNLVTVSKTFIRPWMYRIIKQTSTQLYRDFLKEYPSGMYQVHCGKKLEEVEDMDLDSRWTISRSGLSSHLLSDPECQPLIHIQDIKNTLINLSMDIIEHQIPESFADPSIINFDQHGRIEAAPGYITQTKGMPPGLTSLKDGFFSLPIPQINPGIEAIDAKIDQMGEFVSGDNPAVYGGNMGNRVPGEVYSQSRGSSLQRWNLTWNEIVDVWKRSKVKAVNLAIKHLSEKESFTSKKQGQFITTYIERHELTGQVGEVSPQVSEAFPMTAEQKRNWLVQIISQAKNFPEITAILSDPENRETISDLLGFSELYVDGTDQRLKQLIEYQQLSESEPISKDQPSVPIDFDIDDHNVHIRILRKILSTEIGMELKDKKPTSYQNCLIHLRNHLQAAQSQMQKPYGDSIPGVKAPSSAQPH